MTNLTPIPLITGPLDPSMVQFVVLVEEINARLATINANDAEVEADIAALEGASDVDAGPGGGAIINLSDATALTADILAANAVTNQTVYTVNSATGVPTTLVPATPNQTFEFVFGTKPTANGLVIDCVGSDAFESNDLKHMAAADAGFLNQSKTVAGNHNRMTILNGGAGTGGEIGDRVLLKCYIAGLWHVSGVLTCGNVAVFSAF